MKPIRTEKGLSLLEFPEDYVVIDIETSDMDYFYGEIIEIACVKIKNNQIESCPINNNLINAYPEWLVGAFIATAW